MVVGEAVDRTELKRTAAQAIAAAAAAALSELGFERRGRSPRYWFEDRGWWRLNVWFEPSSFGIRINLSVGPQYLWSLLEHESIDSSFRWIPDRVVEYPTGAMDGSVGPPEDVAAAYARAAANTARRMHSELADDWQHLQRLARVEYLTQADGGLPVPRGFVLHVQDVLLANALLDRTDVCAHVISSHRHALATDPLRHEPWTHSARDTALLEELEAIVTATNSRDLIAARVDASRSLLGMAPMIERPACLCGPPPIMVAPGEQPASERSGRKWFWPR